MLYSEEIHKSLMRLYQCPACDCLPVRYKRRPSTTPTCVRCGRVMIKASRMPKGFRLGFALTTATVTALFVPHIVERVNSHLIKGTSSTKLRSTRPTIGLSGSIAPPPPIDRVTESLDSHDLFSKLEDADSQWQPQEELLPDGSTRFLYKRRAGEPDLSLSELRSLINDPPTFHSEREAINDLLQTLRQAGVRVMLTPTIKKGAAAEWDHSQGVLRIQPQVTEKGSLDFLRVLNHEAIHVAQSCRGGSLFSKPEILGVPVSADRTIHTTLASPVYHNTSNVEKALEREAYSLQNDINKAKDLVGKECKVSPTSSPS